MRIEVELHEVAKAVPGTPHAMLPKPHRVPGLEVEAPTLDMARDAAREAIRERGYKVIRSLNFIGDAQAPRLYAVVEEVKR